MWYFVLGYFAGTLNPREVITQPFATRAECWAFVHTYEMRVRNDIEWLGTCEYRPIYYVKAKR